MTKPNIAIIGPGSIGEELLQRIRKEKRWHAHLLVGRKGHSWFRPETSHGGAAEVHTGRPPTSWDGIDLAFLAIPSYDDGAAALTYMQTLLELGIPVVTCEKSALANHFSVLQPYIDNIGYSATVGGGSGLIDALRMRINNRTELVHVILNGTLNFISDRLRAGNALGQTIDEATRLGYIEPGATDPLDVLFNEFGRDAPKKATILLNLCFTPQHPTTPKEAGLVSAAEEKDFRQQMLRQLLPTLGSKRFIVTFQPIESYAKVKPPELWDIAFQETHEGWYVTGAFRSLDDPLITRLCRAAPGVSNGFLTVEGPGGKDGTCLHVGQGAGPGPTAAAMLRDAERLLTKHKR